MPLIGEFGPGFPGSGFTPDTQSIRLAQFAEAFQTTLAQAQAFGAFIQTGAAGVGGVSGFPGQPPIAPSPPTTAAPGPTTATLTNDLGLPAPGGPFPTGLEGLMGQAPPLFPGVGVTGRQSLNRELARLLRRLNPVRKRSRMVVTSKSGAMSRVPRPSPAAAAGRAIIEAIPGVVGRVFGSVAGVLWPTSTADSTVPGFEADRARRLEELARSQRMPQGPPENFEDDITRQGEQLLGEPAQQDDFDYDPESLGDIVRERARQAVEDRLGVELPRSAPPRREPPVFDRPAQPNQGPPLGDPRRDPPSTLPPRPVPSTTRPTPQAPSTASRRRLGVGSRIGVVAPVAALLVAGSRRRRSETAPNAITAPIDLPPGTPALPSGPSATPGVIAGVGSIPFSQPFTFTSSAPSSSTPGCSCKPKRRGPQRRCLERATVVFKTGRRKGKSAGTKCVRFAN